MAGRKKKLLGATSKNLTKEERAEKEAEEEILNSYEGIDTDIPTVLKGDRLAVAEWKRIVPLLETLPISSLDLYSVTQYCTYVSIYHKTSKSVAKEGIVVDGKENPNFSIMVKASKELKTLTSVLGLTIDSRLRLVVPTQLETVVDPFADVEGD